MNKALYLVLASLLLLGACTSAPQRYGVSVANNSALKQSGVKNVSVGQFINTSNIDNNCRGIYGALSLPDNLTFEGYLQKALTDELIVAGSHGNDGVILTGNIEKLAFSTLTSFTGGGSWDIGLRVKSSNGREIYVSEHYEFDASTQVFKACSEVASAYQPAVQNVLGKLFNSKDFKELVAAKK